jgi:hypothetical protein
MGMALRIVTMAAPMIPTRRLQAYAVAVSLIRTQMGMALQIVSITALTIPTRVKKMQMKMGLEMFVRGMRTVTVFRMTTITVLTPRIRAKRIPMETDLVMRATTALTPRIRAKQMQMVTALAMRATAAPVIPTRLRRASAVVAPLIRIQIAMALRIVSMAVRLIPTR